MSTCRTYGTCSQGYFLNLLMAPHLKGSLSYPRKFINIIQDEHSHGLRYTSKNTLLYGYSE